MPIKLPNLIPTLQSNALKALVLQETSTLPIHYFLVLSIDTYSCMAMSSLFQPLNKTPSTPKSALKLATCDRT